MAKVGVVAVPFILHEFQYIHLVETVISMFSMKHDHTLDVIAIVNAFQRPEVELQWLRSSFDVVQLNDRNNLARAWNKGISLAFERGADYVLVINLDLLFHPLFLENLVKFADAHPEAIVYCGAEVANRAELETADLSGEPSAHAHFSCFMIRRDFFERAGVFDEQFEPAYHEDTDMVYRFKLAGLKPLTTPSARLFHHDRVTLKGAMQAKNREFLDGLRKLMNLSMERYAAKWGGLPGQETFSTPYNK